MLYVCHTTVTTEPAVSSMFFNEFVQGMQRLLLTSVMLAFISLRLAAQSGADTEGRATEPGIHPTWAWAALQLLPSPGYSVGSGGGGNFHMQWQLTPVLYSFGINRRLSPWRSVVVEPLTRQNGSLEAFVSPEYTAAGDRFGNSWLLRTGLRAYLPVVEHGEYLSASLGVGYATYNGEKSLSLDAGVHIFFGVLGLQVSHAPDLDDARWTFTLKIRYF